MQSRHSLVLALFLTTAVVTAALGWAGWRLLSQQRHIDEQRRIEAADAAAAEMVASVRGRLAEAGDRLGAALADPAGVEPPERGVLLTVGLDGAVNVASEPGLPFVPAGDETDVPRQLFVEGEALEGRGMLPAAARFYSALARRSSDAVRGGALLRLGRVQLKAGDAGAALDTYGQLAQLGPVRVESWPAGFIGLYQQRASAGLLGRRALHRDLTEQLADGMAQGTWPLTRGQAEHYWEQLGAPGELPNVALAEAVHQVWTEFGGRLPPRGLRILGMESDRILVMWRSSSTATALLTSRLEEFLPHAPEGLTWRFADAEDRHLGGQELPVSGIVRERLVGEAEYPWTLSVGLAPRSDADAQRGERTLVAMMAAVLLFLWAAMYVMVRAIRREAAVARLQSEFVAAVSHEFRSPLTTIRQMAEMLDLGRVTTDERRRAYYQVLVGEASRLQRLVETLLNFGRMEAGAARYRLAELNLPDVVHRVIDEIGPVARDAGTRIETDGPPRVAVNADEHALGLALRNLIENAIKYSPGRPVVRVGWSCADGRALVCVTDEGVGIHRHEQQAIFGKFVRGRSAIDNNIAGTGLGLAMVRQIVEAHGGDMRLESEPGRGSTFTFTLPLVAAEADLAAGGDRIASGRRTPDFTDPPADASGRPGAGAVTP